MRAKPPPRISSVGRDRFHAAVYDGHEGKADNRSPFSRGRERGEHAIGAGRASTPEGLQTAWWRKIESMANRLRCVLAGSSAALVWAAQEPVDRRAFGCSYSDVAVLGKAVTRGRNWRTVGLAVHALNGALFGLAYYETRRRVPIERRKLAVSMALTEHALLYPLCFFIDRYHPARGEAGVPQLLTNPRAFGQATWRHLIFGVVLGQLA